MKRSEQQIKEVYRLWVEYLKRSEDYKEFCEIIRKNRKNPSLPLPDKFKWIHYPTNYYMFGPIHDKRWTFEEWWELYNKERRLFHCNFPVIDYISRRILGIKEEFQPKGAVEDYVNYLQRDIDICIDRFKFYNKGKEPTLNEFKEYFLQEFKQGCLSQYLTIRIDSRGEKTDYILKQIGNFIRDKRKNSHIKERELKFIKHLKPSTRYIRTEEIEKYLRIYDLRQRRNPKLTAGEIIEKINPNDDPRNIDTKRAYRDFYQKARKIIKFVEYGYFPGPYDETTLKRQKRNA